MQSRTGSWIPPRLATALLAASLIGGCADMAPSAPGQAADPRSACAALDRSLGKSMVGVPLDGVRIDSAQWVDSASPAFCKVRGHIAQAEGGATPTAFEVNLPTDWNGAAVQFGDGIEGRRAPVDPAAALSAGYATYGLGGGAAGNVSPAAQVAAQKRLRDVAAELLVRRHGRFPDRFYLIAPTGGGLTALAAAERFPRLFKGVLADAGGPAAAGGEPATNPLLEFSSSGGKLFILAPDGDSSAATPMLQWYRALVERIGQRSADDFVRVYRLPAAESAPGIERLTALVDWAEHGKSPPAR